MPRPKLKDKIIKNFYDLFFPKFCVSCNLEGNWLCQTCRKEILPVATQVCPECGRIEKAGQYCQKCRKDKAISGIIAAAYYEEGPIREIIHNYKYNSVTEFDRILGNLLIEAWKKSKIEFDLITFCPLHYKRLIQRGYNQSELLAKVVAGKTKKPVLSLLIKRKATKRQVELTGLKRRNNLKNVFLFNSRLNIKSKKIILIDDITTTGSTLNECAKILLEAGAKEVWGLVVARG